MLMLTTSINKASRNAKHKYHDKIEEYAIKTKTLFIS